MVLCQKILLTLNRRYNLSSTYLNFSSTPPSPPARLRLSKQACWYSFHPLRYLLLSSQSTERLLSLCARYDAQGTGKFILYQVCSYKLYQVCYILPNDHHYCSFHCSPTRLHEGQHHAQLARASQVLDTSTKVYCSSRLHPKKKITWAKFSKISCVSVL